MRIHVLYADTCRGITILSRELSASSLINLQTIFRIALQRLFHVWSIQCICTIKTLLKQQLGQHVGKFLSEQPIGIRLPLRLGWLVHSIDLEARSYLPVLTVAFNALAVS